MRLLVLLLVVLVGCTAFADGQTQPQYTLTLNINTTSFDQQYMNADLTLWMFRNISSQSAVLENLLWQSVPLEYSTPYYPLQMPNQYYVSFEYYDVHGRLVFGPRQPTSVPNTLLMTPTDPNNPETTFKLLPDTQNPPLPNEILIKWNAPAWVPLPYQGGWYILWWGNSVIARAQLQVNTDFYIAPQSAFYLNWGGCPLPPGTVVYPQTSMPVNCGTTFVSVGKVPILANINANQFYNIALAYPTGPAYSYTSSYTKPQLP